MTWVFAKLKSLDFDLPTDPKNNKEEKGFFCCPLGINQFAWVFLLPKELRLN